MGKRKVTILEPAVEEVARIALYIEGQGLPKIAKTFVDEAFAFFESLADQRLVHRPCQHPAWIVSYLDNTDEIIICEFALQKLLK
jgi:plasmid stabilization system protein ParE